MNTRRLLAPMLVTIALTWGACSLADALFASDAATSKTAAAPEEEIITEKASTGEYGLLAIGVGLAILGGAIGTGLAQKGIGTAVVAACAEDRSFLGIGVFLLALPETILIIATGIAYLLLQHIR